MNKANKNKESNKLILLSGGLSLIFGLIWVNFNSNNNKFL